MIYLLQPQKSVLLSVAALPALAWLLRKDPNIRGAKLLSGAVAIAMTTLMIDALTGSVSWTALFVRRLLILPGALTVGYVSVFRDRPKTNFADTINPWAESPYSIAPSHLVGAEFTGRASTNANVNFFGHGYLSYGYLGMVVTSLILVALLWAIDSVSEGLPMRALALIWFMPTVALASASIFTAMVTHGVLAGLLFCALLPREGWGKLSTQEVHSRRHVKPDALPDTVPRLA